MADTLRPEVVEDEHLEYLDDLRESGVTNMCGAAPWLANAYTDLTREESGIVHKYWMETFGNDDR